MPRDRENRGDRGDKDKDKELQLMRAALDAVFLDARVQGSVHTMVWSWKAVTAAGSKLDCHGGDSEVCQVGGDHWGKCFVYRPCKTTGLLKLKQIQGLCVCGWTS
jgi:hypothetical protein